MILRFCPLIEAFKCQRGDIKITIIDHRILFLDNDGISTFGSNIGNNLHKFLLEQFLRLIERAVKAFSGPEYVAEG